MPIVQIDMIEGRDIEQKREMAAKITAVISEIAKCPLEAVTIIFREEPSHSIAKAGKLCSDA